MKATQQPPFEMFGGGGGSCRKKSRMGRSKWMFTAREWEGEKWGRKWEMRRKGGKIDGSVVYNDSSWMEKWRDHLFLYQYIVSARDKGVISVNICHALRRKVFMTLDRSNITKELPLGFLFMSDIFRMNFLCVLFGIQVSILGKFKNEDVRVRADV